MKKILFVITMLCCVTPFCKADTDWTKFAETVYDRIPDAEYQITVWVDGEVKYTTADSCEDARRIAYNLLYKGKVDKVKITSKYPTVQTRCWLFGKVFTRGNMDELL